MRKDLKCIACELGKRRRNLVIFVQDDYSCNTETVQKLLCNLKGNDENRVGYICQKCSHNLKKPSHACERKDSKLDHKSSEPCFCTCCHSQFMRKQVVLFEKKNYDFKNKSVNTALGKNCRYKKCIYEYICKTCHGTLRKRRSASLIMHFVGHCIQRNHQMSVEIVVSQMKKEINVNVVISIGIIHLPKWDFVVILMILSDMLID